MAFNLSVWDLTKSAIGLLRMGHLGSSQPSWGPIPPLLTLPYSLPKSTVWLPDHLLEGESGSSHSVMLMQPRDTGPHIRCSPWLLCTTTLGECFKDGAQVSQLGACLSLWSWRPDAKERPDVAATLWYHMGTWNAIRYGKLDIFPFPTFPQSWFSFSIKGFFLRRRAFPCSGAQDPPYLRAFTITLTTFVGSALC